MIVWWLGWWIVTSFDVYDICIDRELDWVLGCRFFDSEHYTTKHH